MLLRLLAFFLLIPTLVFAQNSHLALSSIHSEMQKILEGHLSQKKMTPQLLADSLQLYVVQFDPQAIYLLASEAAPYLKLSSAAKESLLQQYEENSFSRFSSCNKMIQAAIQRMRKFRLSLAVDEEHFLALADKPGEADTVKVGAVPLYVASLEVLKNRHATFMAQSVKRELQAASDEKRELSFKDAVRSVEFDLEEFENSYLFVDRAGASLDPSHAQELFAFHVLKAMTASLDAHTSYLNPREAEMLRMRLEKNYIGIGITIQERGKAFAVESIIRGSSAATSGAIRVGDELVAINGKPLTHESLSSIHELLEGETNSPVTLDLKRGKEPIHVTLQRRQIVLQEGRVDTTFEKMDDGVIGVITLHSFYQGTGSVSSEKDVIKALDLLATHGKVKGVILDLRDNRGGFLMQAVKVAGLFLKSGVVVAAKYSDGSIHYFRDLDPSVLYSGPLIVLISKETASAAEIVAGALKDYGLAIIVGDAQTFGKGSIQMQTVTGGEKDAESYFKVTVGRYYGVSGKSTQLEGVKADIVVPSFLSEKKVGEEFLSKAITGDSIAPSFNDSLSDIPDPQKPWFQEYYVPYIQQPVDLYRRFIPQLAASSAQRIAKNQNYQHLLTGNFTLTEKVGLSERVIPLDPLEVKQATSRLQLQETVDIMKELIKLSDRTG